jgi:hypothetical protein
MTQEPPRQISPSAVQATGQVASDVVSGIKNQPMMLAIVVLNVIGIGIAGWIGLQFLQTVERGDNEQRALVREMMTSNRAAVQEFIRLCFPEGGVGRRQDRGDLDRLPNRNVMRS